MVKKLSRVKNKRRIGFWLGCLGKSRLNGFGVTRLGHWHKENVPGHDVQVRPGRSEKWQRLLGFEQLILLLQGMIGYGNLAVSNPLSNSDLWLVFLGYGRISVFSWNRQENQRFLSPEFEQGFSRKTTPPRRTRNRQAIAIQ